MVVKASRFPECMVEERKQQRYEWEQVPENREKISKIVIEEYQERLIATLNAFAEDGDVDKYLKRNEKNKAFYKQRKEYFKI